MPVAYPPELRRDVIAVARRGERTRAAVARSFGISESCLARWSANRFIAAELPARGIVAGGNRVHRLCTTARPFSVHSKKRRNAPKPGPPVHDDLLEPDFTADRHSRLWLTDITEHPTAEGKLYPCAIKDACNQPDRRLLHRQPDDFSARCQRAGKRCRAAPARRDRGPVRPRVAVPVHAYVHALATAGLTGSMGRVGACADNAAMESFVALLQKNVLNCRRTWAARQDLRLAIVTWIEKSYHRRRRQDRRGHLPPIGYETVLRAAHAA